MRLIPEPVAAGRYFATAVQPVPEGKTLLVYDLGAGTFDVSLLRRVNGAFSVLAIDGLPEFGGLDLDALVVDQIGAVISTNSPAEWARLTNPSTTADRRHHRNLWDDARSARESLSTQSSSGIVVPMLDRDFVISREVFERAAQPYLRKTVELSARLIKQAGLGPRDISAVLLVGGATRTPLVSTMLHRSLGLVPTVNEQPELLVAEGALYPDDQPTPSPAPLIAPVSPGPIPPGPTPISAPPILPVPISPMSKAARTTPAIRATAAIPAPQPPPAPPSAAFPSIGLPQDSFPSTRRHQIRVIIIAFLLTYGTAASAVPIVGENAAAGLAVPLLLIVVYVTLRVRYANRLRIDERGIRIRGIFRSELLVWRDIVSTDVRDGAVWAWPTPVAQLTKKGKPRRRWRKKQQALFVVRMSNLATEEYAVIAALRRYRPAPTAPVSSHPTPKRR